MRYKWTTLKCNFKPDLRDRTTKVFFFLSFGVYSLSQQWTQCEIISIHQISVDRTNTSPFFLLTGIVFDSFSPNCKIANKKRKWLTCNFNLLDMEVLLCINRQTIFLVPFFWVPLIHQTVAVVSAFWTTTWKNECFVRFDSAHGTRNR